MRLRLILPILAPLLIVGCIPPPTSSPIHLYLVHGPLATQQTTVTLQGKVGVFSKSVSLKLPSGEICRGSWAEVPASEGGTASAPTWDSIYGSGHYVANVLGAQYHGKATLTGDQGTILFLEFYRDTQPQAALLGMATDKAGNTYKLTQ